MTTRFKIVGGLVLMAFIGMVLGIVGLISTRMLTSQADELYALQNENSGVASVLNAHYTWRQSLTEAVLKGTEFTGSLDSGACALGTWRQSDAAQHITDEEVLKLLKQVDDPHTFIHNQAAVIKGYIANGDLDAAKSELVDVVLPKTQEVITILGNMESRYIVLLENKSQEIIRLGDKLNIIVVALIVVALIAAAVLCMTITASIMKPLLTITEAAEKIAEGDLDVRVNYHVNDQLGQLVTSFQHIIDSTKEQVRAAEAFAGGDLTVAVVPRSDKDAMSFALGKMVDSLNNMFGEIRSSSSQVSIGSKQIADGAQSLAQGSTEQASAIEELSSNISHITEKTKHNAEISKEAAELSGSIHANAEQGSRQMEQMMQAVQEISEASGQIERVIKVIEDIAFQTNILALNAAVEAARAGTAGRGFAVVAEEVRSLAAKSADAARDTGGLIENSIEKAQLGLTIAAETSASLTKIVDGINRSAIIVEQIARSSEEQVSSISQLNVGIDQVAQVIQQNSATAEESAASSEEMNGQSEMLEQLIGQFKLRDSGDYSTLGTTSRATYALGSGKY